MFAHLNHSGTLDRTGKLLIADLAIALQLIVSPRVLGFSAGKRGQQLIVNPPIVGLKHDFGDRFPRLVHGRQAASSAPRRLAGAPTCVARVGDAARGER